ncbi:MATE family efflux transporter [Mucilaginibacter myungsuensis]|uniref:Polysaccharide biosynthesis protein n=1 Tax=Mucilaginibacter myungsuensis TaxID=649104 RepID=A0A929KUZ0_9SPHI|nr:polysaccharide biosynthesis protein [Mucilaginibacter myungsuensis]MBE9660383.1 polysaccharide biosynthesis protein [Mucilaginibacter myungsuensis]MDN3600425.1 polysaccharide biosynthesis protein [Mucilaginibacter myungsuensis]
MIGVIRQFAASEVYGKLKTYGTLVTIVGSAQVLIQIFAFVSGILIIRTLPTSEYALYTLANTMLGTMTVLADGGIAMGVMSQGGKVWLDRQKLGSVLSTGFYLRKRFAVVSLAIAIPILMYLLRHHDASWLMTGLIVVAIIPAFLMSLSGELLEIAPKLTQDIKPLQKIQIGTNIRRLILLVTTLFIFPWAVVAILASGFPQIWANLKLRKISVSYAEPDQIRDPAVEKEILKLVKKLLPGALYYCLAGQVTIWLISIFGTTSAVAQAGALGRISVMLTLFSVLFGTLVAPRFARLTNSKQVLLPKYLLIQSGVLALCICIISVVYLFPSQILWVLGTGYADLKIELILSILGSCLSLMAGISYSLYANRGWAMNPLFIIPFNIAIIAVGAVLINVSTLKGILLLNIFISTIEIAVSVAYTIIKIAKIKPEITDTDLS